MRAATGPTRRRLLTAGGALGAGALLAACSSSDGGDAPQAAGTDGETAASGFDFTDDRGERVTLDAVPERIVAYVGSAAALHHYGIECAGVFGPTLTADGQPDVQAADLDVDRLTVVGNAWGEFDVETYLSLEPQLLVSDVHDGDALWYVPEESADEVLGLAPSAGIRSLGEGLRLTTVIERYGDLARALGADLSAAPVTEARARFEAAAEELRQATRANPGIRVVVLSATPDAVWFADAAALPDLTSYADLGVEFVSPDDTGDNGVFQSVSWEEADRYAADLILVDSRTGNLQPADLAESKPTWTTLPAVEAGQVAAWTAEPTFSHAGCAPLLEDLARAVRSARRVA